MISLRTLLIFSQIMLIIEVINNQNLPKFFENQKSGNLKRLVILCKTSLLISKRVNTFLEFKKC